MGISRTPFHAQVAARAATALCCLTVAAPAAAADCAGAGHRPDQASTSALAKTTICLLNAERAANGLRSFRVRSKLNRASRAHTLDMVLNDVFSHRGSDGSTFVERIRGTGYLRKARVWRVAENIAHGTNDAGTPAETVKGWMSSAGHRANILDRKLRDIGIGVAVSVIGVRAGTPISEATYTTDFGIRRR